MSESTDLEGFGVIRHVSPEGQLAAAKTVCHYAIDAEDAAELLAMLGLSGVVATCTGCGKPMSRQTNLGRSDGFAGGGVCSLCARRASKREAREARS